MVSNVAYLEGRERRGRRVVLEEGVLLEERVGVEERVVADEKQLTQVSVVERHHFHWLRFAFEHKQLLQVLQHFERDLPHLQLVCSFQLLEPCFDVQTLRFRVGEAQHLLVQLEKPCKVIPHKITKLFQL